MNIRLLLVATLLTLSSLIFLTFEAPTSAQRTDRLVKAIPSTQTSKRLIPEPFSWHTIVNNSISIPGHTVVFSSYGQPSINSQGMIVFRARSTGGQHITGIFTKQFPKGFVDAMADVSELVPYPNNLATTFTEFPSIPRIAMNSNFTATRGIHKPVYRFLLPDGTESRAGTTGIYVDIGGGYTITGASKLGAVPEFEQYSVPGFPGVAFDVFPGSPAINDRGTIAFKGNFTINGVGKTGISVRHLLNTPGGGNGPSEMIASSDTEIPNLPPSMKFRSFTFGSTAPPSIVGNDVVFLGLDNEDNPHFGGIYLANLKTGTQLREIVGIGKTIPGVKTGEITLLGESLAFDGRYLGFWAAWGREMKTVRLYCPEDGNSDIKAYCNGVDPLSVFDEDRGKWYQERNVPVHQGMFVYDLHLERAYSVATTDNDFTDFLFWVYSGKAPSTEEGDDDAEPPRWRSSAFGAVSDGMMALKARTGILNDTNEYIDIVDGLYLGDPSYDQPMRVVAETGMNGASIDPTLTTGFPAPLPITGLGIERDGFRGNMLAITATMANEEDSWGGIYMTHVTRGPMFTK